MIHFKVLDVKKQVGSNVLVVTAGFYYEDYFTQPPFYTGVYEFQVPEDKLVMPSADARGWIDDGAGGLTRPWVEVDGEWVQRTDLAATDTAAVMRKRVTAFLNEKAVEFTNRMEYGIESPRAPVEDVPTSSRMADMRDEIVVIEEEVKPRRRSSAVQEVR
jgi:hypothetical protein